MVKDLPAIEGGVKTRENFLAFGSPLIEEEAISSVVESLRSGWIGTGPKTQQFERDLESFLSVKHCIVLNSCTAALHLAMKSLGIGPGDEVLVPTFTFCATANSVLYVGGTPVFVDIDPATLNLDIKGIEKKITPKTKAIIPVHIAGLPCDMDAIMAIAHKHKLLVIEDSAHAIEGQYKGKKTGTIAELGCYSFYVTKNITTAEGGAIVTNNSDRIEYLRQASLHGLNVDAWKRFSAAGFKPYEVSTLGFKYNMTDMQSALGLVHLKKVHEYLERRNQIWQSYQKAFADLPITLAPEIPTSYSSGSTHSRHLYIIRLQLDKFKTTRDRILNAIQAEGIGSGIHYKPLHLHEFYKKTLSYRTDEFTHANKIADEILSIPITHKLTEQDCSDIINAVSKVVRFYTK